MSDINEIIKLWAKVLNSRSKPSKEHNDWLSVFLSKYILACCTNPNLPTELSKRQVNICNVLSHSLLSDIHNVCSLEEEEVEGAAEGPGQEPSAARGQRGESKTEAQLVGKYLLAQRGWKVIWALLSTSLEGLSYHAELAELLLSLLSMVLQIPMEGDELQTVQGLFPDKEPMAIEECFYLLSGSLVSSDKKANRFLSKKAMATVSVSCRRNLNSSDSESSPDQLRNGRRLRAFPHVSFIQSSHHFDYFSQPCLKSEAEDEQREEEVGDEEEKKGEEEENVGALLSRYQRECAPLEELVLTSPRITDLILRLLQKIFLKKKKWRPNEQSSLLPHQLALCKAFTQMAFRSQGVSRHQQGWGPAQLAVASSQLLRLVLLVTGSLTDKNQNHYLREDLVRELLGEAKASLAQGAHVFAHECLLACLCMLQCSVGCQSGGSPIFVRLVKLFSSGGGSELLADVVLRLEKESEHQKCVRCVLGRLSSLLHRLRSSPKRTSAGCSKRRDLQGSFDIVVHHHHRELSGRPSSQLFQDGFCCVLTLNRVFLSIFSRASRTETLTCLLQSMNRVGVCCCTGFGPLLDSFLKVCGRLGPPLQAKLLLFLERTLLRRAAETQGASDLCPLCSSQSLLTCPSEDLSAWSHISLYGTLLQSCDCPLARAVCRHLLSLCTSGSEAIREAVFSRVALPVFARCLEKEKEEEEKWLCLMEFCLLSMVHLLEDLPALVGPFLDGDLMSRLGPLLSCPRLRLLALDLLTVLIGSSQQLVDGQPECHPAALEAVDTMLASCDVCYLTKCLDHFRDSDPEGGELWSQPVQDLFFCSSVWHSCQKLLSCPAFRKHLVSGKGLGTAFHLLEQTLEALALPYPSGVRRSVVALQESLFSLCLQLAPFYDIRDGKYVTVEFLLEMVQGRLLKCDAVSAVWLRQVYDSLLNCSINVSSKLRAPTVSWAFQRQEDEEQEVSEDGFQKTGSSPEATAGLGPDDGSSCLADLESEAVRDHKGGKANGRRCVIVRPQVTGLVLRLLWHHLRSSSSPSSSLRSPRGSCCSSRQAFEGANYVLQRLAALCKQEPTNKAILYDQDILQYIYKFMDISFGSENDALVHEFQIVLVDLWVCVSVHSVSRGELFTYLRFVKDHPQATPLLLNGLTEVLNQASREPFHCVEVTGPRVGQATTPGTEEGQDPSSPSLEPQPGSYVPLTLHKTHCSAGLDYEVLPVGQTMTGSGRSGPSPWALASLALPLSQDPSWNPRPKGLSAAIWIRIQIEDKQEARQKLHLVSWACNFWLLEIWFQPLDGSLVVRVSHSSSSKHTVLAEVTLQSVLTSGLWQHLTFTYKEKSTRKDTFGELCLTVDGSQPHTALLKYSADGYGKHKCLSSCVLLGHSSQGGADPTYSSSPSCLCQIGTFMLFKGVVLDLPSSYVLSSLGPNLENLTEGAVEEGPFQPFPLTPRLLRTGLDVLHLADTAPEIIRKLQVSLFMVFNASSPETFLLYPYVVTGGPSLMPPTSGSYRVSAEDERCSQHHPAASSALVFGQVGGQQQQQQRGGSSLHLSLEQLGGPDLLLFLFARVVGETQEEEIQSSSLHLLLEVLRRFPCCTQSFLRAQGPALLQKVLENHSCRSGPLLLKTLLNCAVSQPVMRVDAASGSSSLDSQMDSLVVQPWLLALCVASWRAWDSNCLASLFRCLEFLVREKHSFASFNLGCLHQVEIVQQILGMLKELFQDDRALCGLLSRRVCWSVCRLLCRLVGCDPRLLSFVWETILLFHPQDQSHMSHTRLYLDVPQHPQHNKNHNVSNASPQRMSWKASEPAPSGEAVTVSAMWSTPTGAVEEEEECDRKEKGAEEEQEEEEEEGGGGEDDEKEEEDSLDLGSSDNSSINMRAEEAVRHSYSSLSSTGTRGTTPPLGRSEIFRALELLPHTKIFGDQKEDPDKAGDVEDDDSNEKDREDLGDEEDNQNQQENPLICIVTGLLDLVRDVLLTVPDSAVGHLVPDVVKPSAILFLVNHPSPKHRAAVVQLFGAFVQRCSVQVMSSFIQMHGFQLFTNQLHQFPADSHLLAAVVTTVSCQENEFERICEDSYSKDVSCERHLHNLLLLGLLAPSAEDTTLAHNILSQMMQVAWNDKVAIDYFFKNGAVNVLCSFLLNIGHQDLRPTDIAGVYEQDLLIDDVHQLLSTFAEHFLLQWEDSASTQNLEDLLTNLSMNFVYSCQHCGSSSRCVFIFRDCVCMVLTVILNLTNKLLDYSLSERFRGTVVVELLASLPGLLHPFVGLGQEGARHTRFPSGDGSRSRRDAKTSRAVTAQLIHRFSQLLARACNFLIYQSSVVSYQSWSSAWEDLALNLLNILGKKLQICLALNNKSYTSFRFAGLNSLKDAVATQLSKFCLWQLVPEQPLPRRRSIVAFLCALTDSQNILTAMLQHTTPTAFLQMLSFLQCLLDVREEVGPQDRAHVLKIIGTMTKCKTSTIIDVDNRIINEALSSWQRSVELEREHWQAQLKQSWDICQSSQQALREDMARIALQVTREVVDQQNRERKALMQMLKVIYAQRLASQRAWKEALATMTHERALWHEPCSYPVSWQLDPTEGPLRVRRKLQRCFLNIDPKFVLPESREKLEAEQRPGPLAYLFEEDDFLSGRDGLIQRLYTDEQISFCCNCTVVIPSQEIPGEILIGDRCVHFVGDKEVYERTDLEVISQVWLLSEIREILHRRFQLQDNALELFLTSGQTYLLAFESPKVRDSFFRHLSECALPALVSSEQLNTLTDRWRTDEISNYEYLTQLNKLAGRSFNDLMQYPVFPFLLSDYTGEQLDLTHPQSFRNLSKPMAIQDKKKEKHYTDLYKYLKSEHESCSSSSSDMLLPTAGAYHYGSHYSNSGTVLHFLVRLPPFTRMMLAYQDKNFDLPDRTFHSMHTSWRLASGDSATDFKELIPEFFYLPEFLVNSEALNLGVRQTGEAVRDVSLPPWCRGDARLFVLIHRQALECPLVTANLHRWVDLVFGYQQTGKAAVEAINLFHPATYYGLDISPVQDPLKLGALRTMIRTFGQMPKQLFTAPHPAASPAARASFHQTPTNTNNNNVGQPAIPEGCAVLPQVKGLCWGSFVGSPSTPAPKVAWRGHHPMPLGSLLPLATGEVYGLAARACLLLSYSKEKAAFLNTTYVTSAALVSWGHPDGVVRIKLRRDAIPQPLLRTQASDPVTVCAAVPDCSILFVGRASGLIRAHKLNLDFNQGLISQSASCVVLHGHSREVSCLSVSKAFSLMVSGGLDGSLLLWDLNRLSYVRTIVSHQGGCIKMCCVSETLGDIAAVAATGSSCCLTVHTVNGRSVGRIQMAQQVTALGYSSMTEGLAVNVLATGFGNGTVRLWSSWNLESVCELKLDGYSLPIVCLTFSVDSQHLFLCNCQGRLVVWQRPPPSRASQQQSQHLKIPNFLTVL